VSELESTSRRVIAVFPAMSFTSAVTSFANVAIAVLWPVIVSSVFPAFHEYVRTLSDPAVMALTTTAFDVSAIASLNVKVAVPNIANL